MVERVLLGKHPDTGVVGLWVSRPTKNARTSTDLADFLVHPDKINQRPVARFAPVKFTRGEFVNTITYSDGTKGDRHVWRADYFHNFGYVPIVLIQIEQNTGQGPPWVDAAKINIAPITVDAFRYNNGDASKTPIAGSWPTGPIWSYNTSDGTLNYVGSSAPTTYTLYRNSIT